MVKEILAMLEPGPLTFEHLTSLGGRKKREHLLSELREALLERYVVRLGDGQDPDFAACECPYCSIQSFGQGEVEPCFEMTEKGRKELAWNARNE